VDGRRERLANARLYLVCGEQPEAFLHAALRGGVDIVQLRMKGAGDEQVISAGERTARACAEHGALFVLNDRPDLAVATGADGVHVGQDDTPVARAREIIGDERLLGLSTHSPEQVDSTTGVDYIGVGPVEETPTKPGRPAVGFALVTYAASHAAVPFFAIGGIGAHNALLARDAGATRIAVVRAVTESEDPEGMARGLRAAIAGRHPVGAA
jgi:thiamine-phosphate pyrophosphorylase